MKFEDFYKEQYQQEQEASQSWRTIAQITVNLGYQAFVTGEGMTKVFIYGNEKDKEKAKADCKAYLEQNNPDGWAQAGIALTIDGTDVPTHPQGKFERDWEQFVPMFQSSGNLEKFKADVLEKFNELSANREVRLPADLFIEKLSGKGIEPGKPAWAELSQQIDWYAEASGRRRTYTDKDGEEKETPRRIYVIEKTYPNREAALADLGQVAAPDEQFSETAKKNYSSLDNLKSLAGEISGWLDKAAKGVAFSEDPKNFPLPEPNTPPARIKYIADLYNVEPSDIMKLTVDTPF
jgi:hypothetical protein